MCGIVGVIGEFSPNEGLEIVSRMNRAILHRGPDEGGQWASGRVAFGMRRLSIIDLAGGHQPIWTEDGVGIIFNGEIYNYSGLRNELLSSGYRFDTHSDTEVVLKMYHRDGLACFSRMEGMFAVCLYDPRVNKLHLVRDRLGVKPLYYGEVGGKFYFASEIKAIVAGSPESLLVDRQALHDYLTLRFVPSCETVWQGISKLAPGHILSMEIDGKGRHLERYWQLRFASEPLDCERNYVQEFEALFLSAVEKRLVASDVPVGVLLSGGLDSSAVCAAAVELGHKEFHTFTVAFEEGGVFDESFYARSVAAHIGSIHHEIKIGQQDFLNFLPRMVQFSDEPLADLACVPLHHVCHLARNDVKVVLSGEGSDELLGGYDMERFIRTLYKLRMIDKVIPSWMLEMVGRAIGFNRYGQALQLLAKHGWSGMPAAKRVHMTHHFDEAEKAGLWRTEAEGYRSTDELISSWYAQAASSHPLDQVQQVYCREWLVEDLLMKADKMSMANSLELREPFLDHHLAVWAARLPIEWKVGSQVQGFVSKRILRAFAEKRIPAAILKRPKQGFPVPAYQWLRGVLGYQMQERVCRQNSKLGDYFETDQLATVFASARQGNNSAAHKAWVMITLELWLEEWT